MKVRNLTNGLLVSLLFSVTAVEADSKYPATDFQPKVVYQDSSYKHSGSSAATTSGGAVSVADSNYPAANFQPEVLYQAKAISIQSKNQVMLQYQVLLLQPVLLQVVKVHQRVLLQICFLA